ncbi:hypothetical protein [Lysinibacillus xylanilyticus]|nr:hypothetical protein [Lysinibacillus xylanilyticus]
MLTQPQQRVFVCSESEATGAGIGTLGERSLKIIGENLHPKL